MRDWHPLSKLVVLVGGVATVVLVWFEWSSESQPVAHASTRPAGEGQPSRSLLSPTIDLSSPGVLVELPPLDMFSATIERPLFSPDRRPFKQPEPAAEVEPDEPEPEPQVVAEPAVDEPDIFFVGTVRRNDQLLALITPFDDYVVSMFGAGEDINGWTIVEIDDRLLVLQQDEEERRLSILQ